MRRERTFQRPKFPWLALVLLLGTIYLFWILPRQLGPRPVKVEIDTSAKRP